MKYICPDDKVTMFDLIMAIEKYYDDQKSIKSLASNISEDDINRDNKLFKISNNHYLNIKGVELIFHEFKEIIIELALKIKGKQVEEGGKLKVRAMLKKFIDESIINNEGISLTQKLPP